VIRLASSPHDYQAFATLIDEYVRWIRTRYGEDERFVTEVLDQQSLAGELANLPTIYGPPNGRAYLAGDDDEARGCGAWRRLDDATCEMKRVFVPERFQGAGLGRALCESVLDAARAAGFASMKLDTLHLMREAVALYKSFGFLECAPYHVYPDHLMPYFVFMELRL
jgi:GNAT superfamily N-acetyltransferase